MNKKGIHFLAMGAIAFVMYNILVFAIGGFSGHEAAFWISYVFTVIAFGLVGLSAAILGKTGMAMRDWLFGYPIVRHCIIYVCAQLFASVMFMIFEYDIEWVLPAVVQVLLLGVFGILVLSCFAAKNVVGEIHQKVEKKTRYIALLQADAQMLANKCEDPEVKRQCEKLAEAIRFSDPMSNELLAGLEQNLMTTVSACGNALDEGNYVLASSLCEKAMQQLAERNTKCKVLK